jgi:hypothetical protein
VSSGWRTLWLDQPAVLSLDGGLGPGGGAQLAARIVDVAIDGPLSETKNLRDLGGGLSARGPGKRFEFTLVQLDRLYASNIARGTLIDGTRPARIDDGDEDIEIDQVCDIVVGAEPPRLEFLLAVGPSGEEHEWHVAEAGHHLGPALEHGEARHERHADVTQDEVRVSEVVQLRADDLILNGPIPYVKMCEHIELGHTRKTSESRRGVPLVGIGIWAAQQALEQSGGHDGWLFRFGKRKGQGQRLVNLRLKELLGTEKRSHSFRHSVETRLTRAEVSQEIIDAIVGHASKTKSRIASGYFHGFKLETLRDALEKITVRL